MLYFPTLFICCETYNIHVYWLKASEKLSENEKEGPTKDGIEACWRDRDQNIGTLGEVGEENILNDRQKERTKFKATDSEHRMAEIRYM